METGNHLHLYEISPAECWEQAYPLGNGRMGAVVWNTVIGLSPGIIGLSCWSITV